MQVNKYINLILIIVLSTLLIACNKPYNYKACFTTTKDTFSIGEKVIFTNCSNFDGGFTNCLWDFGEGPPSKANSIGNAAASYTFTYSGNKTVVLLIGEKENESEAIQVLYVR